MKWYYVKHKQTGEGQFTASLGGFGEEVYEITPLDGSPTDCCEVKNGKLVENKERKSKKEKHSKIRANVFEYIEALEARIVALEKRGS